MFCVALEGNTRSHEWKSKSVNVTQLSTMEWCVCVCLHTCTHSDLGTNMPAVLEKELDMRRGITWMCFKVFSPKGPSWSSTQRGGSYTQATSLDHSFPLPPFIWKTLPRPLQISPWSK